MQGNCAEAPPVEWQSLMNEPLPPRACVIRTPEDFVEMTKGVGELWIDNLYVMVDTEPFREGECYTCILLSKAMNILTRPSPVS